MSKFSCVKCGKEFNSKSNYNQHQKRKTPCINDVKINGIKLLVEKHKTIGGNIKNTYDYLLNEKMIQPFLYL